MDVNSGTGVHNRPWGQSIRKRVRGPASFLWLILGAIPSAFPPLTFGQQPEQQSPGTITGNVVDPKGTPVAGAQVKLTPGDQSPSRDALTDDDGQFSFPNVSPGSFQLTFSAAGFAPQFFSGTVHPGETCVVPQIKLPLAAVTAEVTVVLSPIEIAEASRHVRKARHLVSNRSRQDET